MSNQGQFRQRYEWKRTLYGNAIERKVCLDRTTTLYAKLPFYVFHIFALSVCLFASSNVCRYVSNRKFYFSLNSFAMTKYPFLLVYITLTKFPCLTFQKSVTLMSRFFFKFGSIFILFRKTSKVITAHFCKVFRAKTQAA